MNLVKRFLPMIGLVMGLLRGAEAQESERLYPLVGLAQPGGECGVGVVAWDADRVFPHNSRL